jgi:hypothetical protein
MDGRQSIPTREVDSSHAVPLQLQLADGTTVPTNQSLLQMHLSGPYTS